jgi:hypothetical protein
MLFHHPENAYNVLPTLVHIGSQRNVTVDIQKQIIRAMDNLSSKRK